MNIFMSWEHVKEKSTDTQREHTVEETLNYSNVHPVCGQSYKLVKYTHTHTGACLTADFTYLTNQMTHDTLSCNNPISPIFFSQFLFLHLSQSLFSPHPHNFSPSIYIISPSPDILPGYVFWDLWSIHGDWWSTPRSVILVILPLLRAPIHSSIPPFLFMLFPQRTLVSPSVLPPSFKVSFL